MNDETGECRDGTDDGPAVSRRWYVRAAGMAAVAGLAGCSTGEDDSDAPSDDTPDPGTPPVYERAGEIRSGNTIGLFGMAIAVSDDGTTAVVSERTDDDPETPTSAVNVFTEAGDGWERQATLVEGDGRGTNFGLSVDISGDGTTALVSALDLEEDGVFGSVYVFEEIGGSWSRQATLLPEDTSVENLIASLAISERGTTAVVGNVAAFDTPDEGRGEAYVFQKTGGSWRRQATLRPVDSTLEEGFGLATDISADGATVVVGAPVDSRVSVAAGTAYVFSESNDTWRRVATYTPDDEPGPGFGISVGISGDGTTALVGSPVASGVSVDGAAYVFSESSGSWRQTSKLVSDGDVTVGFGWRVALSEAGDTALVSAPQTSGEAGGEGHVFSRVDDSWGEPSRLDPGDDTEAAFGYAVALSGDGSTVLITSPALLGGQAGPIHVFRRSPDDPAAL